MGTAQFCYPSGFILDCNLSLTQPLNRMQQWVTAGWQRNDLVAVLSHAAMPHSIQDFIFFSFKLSKVIPSHFLDGRMLPSQLGRYCRNQCWCHWTLTLVQWDVQSCLKCWVALLLIGLFVIWDPDGTIYAGLVVFGFFLTSDSLCKPRKSRQFCLLELLLHHKWLGRKWMFSHSFPNLLVTFLWRV